MIIFGLVGYLMKKFDYEGKLVFPKEKHQRIQRKQYLDEWDGQGVQNVWDDIFPINPMAIERINYPTQKPESLLDRIIKTSSNENDLVLDCFGGSGTTAEVAEKLNRRWITCDLGRFSIHTIRKRLLGIPDVKPFIIQNLGKYERQQWMQNELKTAEGNNSLEQRIEIEKNYRNFILDLYNAQPINGHVWVHGVKSGRMVHIGSVDAPITHDDVKNVIKEFWQMVGKDKNISTNGIDILGWDFAFEINETAKHFAAENKVDLKIYQNHPEHLKVIDFLRKVRDKRTVVDYEI